MFIMLLKQKWKLVAMKNTKTYFMVETSSEIWISLIHENESMVAMDLHLVETCDFNIKWEIGIIGRGIFKAQNLAVVMLNWAFIFILINPALVRVCLSWNL